jgi:hypothetical protein
LSILYIVRANSSASQRDIFLTEQIIMIRTVLTGSAGLARLISSAVVTGDENMLLERDGILPMMPFESVQTVALNIEVSSSD